MRSWDEPKKRKARVEIIPMIDVMMFLLVFFVLISLNVIPALGLKTRLPSSSTAQDLKPQTKAVITIAKDDVIQVDGENTTLDALTARLDKLRGEVQQRLWILDTIVTAAPLLGLLGTILGIIDTFKALAVSGVSDPGQVSQGIGTALYATALGIGIAVVGMFFFNLFQERIERINDHLKVLMLRACVGRLDPQPQHSPQPQGKLHIA